MPTRHSRIESALRAARASGRRGFIPFLTAGYPDRASFIEAAARLGAAGADVLEVGVPFSDPIADGPTIQRASQRALEAGVTARAVLELVSEVRARTQMPIVLMTYLNPVLRFGAEPFARAARAAGADGVLVSDLPPEEGGAFFATMRGAGLDTVLLVAPTSGPERLAKIAAQCLGFLYLLSRTGVTGAGGGLSARLGDQLALARAATSLPLAVGFGLRSGVDVAALPPEADAVVVGAALLERLEAGRAQFGAFDALVNEIRGALPLGGGA